MSTTPPPIDPAPVDPAPVHPAPKEPVPVDPGRLSRRSFATLIAAGLAGAGGWWWLRTCPTSDGIPWPLRWMHRLNETLGRGLFSSSHLAPEFPLARAAEPRVNGNHGRPLAKANPWRVSVDASSLTVPELFAGVPRAEHTTELKCIEGWSQVVTWSGVRFADAANKHGWPVTEFPYVSLETPTGDYYVGLDMPSALHPQTLLCDSMNGEPLTESHGGPLRLVIPVKYGIKHLKWLARIRFSHERPADFWAERGYDWYSGL